GLSDVAPAIDHEADCHLGDRSDEARRRVGDENPLGASGGSIDIANIDCDPQERDQIFHQREELSRAGGLPVRDYDLAALSGLRQRLGVEHLAGIVEPHVAELAQLGESALAVVVLKHVGDVSEKNCRHSLLRACGLLLRGSAINLAKGRSFYHRRPAAGSVSMSVRRGLSIASVIGSYAETL